MTTAIHRYEIPVDDRWHDLELSGAIIHVASRRPDVVEVWAHTGGPATIRRLRVFGTGHPLPDAPLAFCGTALVGPLVWHLVEIPIAADADLTGVDAVICA